MAASVASHMCRSVPTPLASSTARGPVPRVRYLLTQRRNGRQGWTRVWWRVPGFCCTHALGGWLRKLCMLCTKAAVEAALASQQTHDDLGHWERHKWHLRNGHAIMVRVEGVSLADNIVPTYPGFQCVAGTVVPCVVAMALCEVVGALCDAH